MRKVFFFLAACFLTGKALAADKIWVGASGAAWSNPVHWSPTGVPGTSDKAIFNATASVNIDVAFTVGGLHVTNNSILVFTTATSRNIQFNWSQASGTGLFIEAGSTLRMSVTGGTSINFNLVSGFGSYARIDGTLEFIGVNSSNSAKFDYSNGGLWEFYGKCLVGVNGGNPTGAGALAGNVQFKAGGTYEMADNGGALLTTNTTWDPSSNILITGLTTGSSPWFSWGTGPVGNVTYDCPNSTSTVNLLGSLSSGFVIAGNLTINNTNGQKVRLGTAPNLNIKGDLIVNGLTTNFVLANTGSSSTSTITIEKGITQTGGTIDIQEAAGPTTLTIWGNILQTAGTLTESGTSISEVFLQGTTNQNVSFAGQITNDVRITVNNSAGVTSTTNWVMPNSANSRLQLTQGNINMGNNLLNIQSPAFIALNGGSASSHVIGKVRRATNNTISYVFPVSNSATEVATVKILPATTSANVFEVSFTRPNPYNRMAVPNGIVNAADYVWDISRISGADNANLTFVYGQVSNNFSSGNSGPEANLRVLHWNGASWDDIGGAGAGGEITATNVSTFSPFTLGTTGPVGLPVNLLSFAGRKDGNTNKLTWVTASEQDNKGFHIERSLDGQRFTDIGFVSTLGNRGNSNSQLSYSFTDNSASGVKQYYRLRQEDINGRTKNSQVVMIQESRVGGLMISSLYPNPVADRFVVQVQSPDAGNINLSVIDQAGRIVIQTKRRVNTGINPVEFNVSQLMAGVYILKIEYEKGEVTQQVIIK